MPLAANCTSQGGEGIFHSFNVGYLHMIMVSSEVFFSVQPHSAGLLIEQSEWLTADLKAVDRSVTPFVALGLHQPFYCSANDDQDDCHQLVSAVRLGLEKIIYEGGVDIVFQAHEHGECSPLLISLFLPPPLKFLTPFTPPTTLHQPTFCFSLREELPRL